MCLFDGGFEAYGAGLCEAVFVMHEAEGLSGRETVIIVQYAAARESEEEVEESLEEMRQLADTAGVDVVCTFTQRRNKPCAATLIGTGKVEEVRAVAQELEADAVIFDADLSPRQGSKLEKLLGVKVVDRTQLILDIFAQHAHTNEGKLQVELAQLMYALPRLAGRGSIMRQQGGLGVRGPGEQKLELDRRAIRRRMGRLEKELDNIRRTRQVQRRKRVESAAATVSIVGYTNAGKSSLLNALAGSDLGVKDKLFATLDPRSRRCRLPSEQEIILTDTVGFIRKLPHSLVAAFRATLEEIQLSDLLIIVADASNPTVLTQLRAVNEVLEEIKVSGKPAVTVFNKIDLVPDARARSMVDSNGPVLMTSAKTGQGLEAILDRLDLLLTSTRRRITVRIPQSEGRVVAMIHEHGRVISQAYEGDQILIEADVDRILETRVAEYVE